MTDNEISSISDLLRILTELGEAAEGRTRFFRGQGKADWEILPGIYRNQKLVENEDKIIKDMADSIEKLIHEPELRKRYGENVCSRNKYEK